MTQIIKPQPSDADLALKALRAFKQPRGTNSTVTLPKLEANSAIGQAIQEVFEHFARGEAVQVSSADRELTTQEAADWLQVSRPHLVKLLELGLIPFYKVGNQRRVRFFDLKHFHKMQREAALNELSQLQQEMGLYD
jgi:excisionase family DNA binding protein